MTKIDDKNTTETPNIIDLTAEPAHGTAEPPLATAAAQPPDAPPPITLRRPPYRPVGLPPWGEP